MVGGGGTWYRRNASSPGQLPLPISTISFNSIHGTSWLWGAVRVEPTVMVVMCDHRGRNFGECNSAACSHRRREVVCFAQRQSQPRLRQWVVITLKGSAWPNRRVGHGC